LRNCDENIAIVDALAIGKQHMRLTSPESAFPQNTHLIELQALGLPKEGVPGSNLQVQLEFVIACEPASGPSSS
jgi:hypothetical protein